MKKRLLSALLVLCMVLTLLPSTAFAANSHHPFTDVSDTAWYSSAVQYVYEHGMMTGTNSAGTVFSPDSPTSRGMIVTILHRLEGTSASGMTFEDVPTGQWYTDAVAWASGNNIMNGYGNGKFGPADPITREQMATTLYRYAQYKGYDTTITGDVSVFSDGGEVSSYAVDAVNWAIGVGLFNGVGNNMFAPTDGALRSQTATVLMRFCEDIASEYVTVFFNYNYNDKGTYKAVAVKNGKTVTSPVNPTRIGYDFDGWYTEPSGGRKFDFSTAVTSDLTLYAHWTVSDSDGPVFYYTVKFDVVASDVSNIPASQKIRSGDEATEPSEPSRSGYNFVGWYIDNTYTEKYDFKLPVTTNITLYAKWSLINSSGAEVEDDMDGKHTVAFDLNGDSEELFEVQVVEDGEKAVAPSRNPDRELYGFTGWYADPSGAVEYDFNSPVTSDLTLYAGWGNPNGNTDSLYAASDAEETVYSVSGLFMDSTGVTATVNVNSTAILLVEFFEDTLGANVDNWTPENMAALLRGTPAVRIATYTPDYGELINVSIPVEGTLPAYYIVRARLLSADDPDMVDLCDPFLYIEGSQQYAEFAGTTINDFNGEQVINFDQSDTTNFGVLADGTKIITVSETSNILTVADIDVADKLVPDHTYTFANPDSSVSGLVAGDIVYIDGTQYLFKVKEAIPNADGSVTVTQDNDASFEEFYSTLKVDMASASDDGIQPMAEIIDVNTSLSKDVTVSATTLQINNWGSLEWSGATINESLDIKIVYDVHLFGENYFECSLISKTTLETSVELKASLVDSEGENPFKKDLANGKGKVPIPTPIPGLEVYFKVGVPVELKFSADVSATWKATFKNGFTYNSYSGKTAVKDSENTLEVKAEGKAEFKIGPEFAIGVQLTGEVVSIELNGSAGAKITVTVAASNEDVHDTLPSHHACIVCLSGDLKWFAEAHVKASYDLKVLKGDFLDWKIFGIEGPIKFLGQGDGKFYVSIVPGPDSVFFKKNTDNAEFFIGGGTCPNTSYRTELKTVDENETELSGIAIRVLKNNNRVDKTGTSSYVVYLHNGVYNASATINGTDVSKTVVVADKAQTISISPTSGDKKLTGKVVDSTDSSVLGDATIKVSKDGVVVASTKSKDTGEFKVSVPEGTYLVEVTKTGYIPYTIYHTVDSDLPSSQVKTIEMIPGSGNGGFRGVITDAVTGDPIGGVTLLLRSGWGNTTGEVKKQLTTDSNGSFRYGTIEVFNTGIFIGLPAGNYTLTAKKSGYIETSFDIIVLPGATDAHPQQNAVMAPAQAEGDSWTIVLTWGENPRDLDSHVVGTLSNGDNFHVYFSHKSQYDGDIEVCNLDRDDTTSYGPETITLKANSSAPYYYYIYRYAGVGSVASSGAQIKVYHGSDPVRTFNVPTGYGDGDYWNVFAIVDGKLVIQNTITDRADITYAGASGMMAFSFDDNSQKLAA